ncbi:phosphotransferase family protein [Spirosoma foliorum]|uniref:Aminoglycoside phosphotransferase family protein n=1 Tax=Spirosoma foliorum TaxID=2710596 RepID=A0A7G5GU16_9BACT|nr:aminoglycoside phosphotransferase family protein [Spirosoma foliorum]QMW02358.1 aminoglycoside phosphotransferase family protein [Spirosoma foliorum]
MLDQLKNTILACFPDLADATFTLLTTGWDSVAVDIDDRLVFKFPRDPEAIEALRREATMLTVIRPSVTIQVPDLEFFEKPVTFSKHTKLKGEPVTRPQYELLGKVAKESLAKDIARFYGELHAIEPDLLRTAGALPIDQWPSPDIILAGIQPLLPKNLLPKAQQTLKTWAQLPPDLPIYGFFDGHGRNMAFDYSTQQLTGIYDFGDAGFGELHEEFIYTSFISKELTADVISHYEQLTGRTIDHNRVHTLTGVLLLTELADMVDDPEHGATCLENALTWLTENS